MKFVEEYEQLFMKLTFWKIYINA